MKIFLFKNIIKVCHLIFIFFIIGCPRFAYPKSIKSEQDVIKNFLEYCEKNKASLFKNEIKNQNQKNNAVKVQIYFFWTSWCDYCPSAYRDLVNWQKRFGSDILIVGYDMDIELNDLVKNKAKQMGAIEHFYIEGAPYKKFPEFSRTPIVIVKSVNSQELAAFTGYSLERSQMILKKVTQYAKQEK